MRVWPAVLGLVFLTGCVGSDPNAALRGVGAPHLAGAPMTPGPVAAVEVVPFPGERSSGDLRAPRGRVVGGVDPVAVLARSEVRSSRMAYAGATPVETPAVVARPAPPPAQAAPTLATGPLLAAHFGPSGSPSPAAAVSAPARRAPDDVETRAAAEQRLQAVRDRRFDTTVRRATNLVCSGCVAGPMATTGRVRRAQAVAPDDVE